MYGASKLRKVTDLAYAVTGHKGMGGTVSAGSAYVTGREPLEWLYADGGGLTAAERARREQVRRG